MKLAGSVAAVTVATLLVWALEPFAPTLSLGVLYVFAVLPVAIAWGLRWSLPVAVASMLAFNWFFLPPVHTFTLRDSTNWFALLVYSATAVVVSELAARYRRRAADAEQRERESSLLAEIATHLLGGRPLETELGWVGEQAAEVLGIDARRDRARRRRAPRQPTRRSRSRSRAARSARSTRRPMRTRTSPCGSASCRRSPRCSPSRSTAAASSRRRSRPRRCAAATS